MRKELRLRRGLLALIFLGVAGLGPWGAVSTVQAASATASNDAVIVEAEGVGVLAVQADAMHFNVFVSDDLSPVTVRITAKHGGKLVEPDPGTTTSLPVAYRVEFPTNLDEEPAAGTVRRVKVNVKVKINSPDSAVVSQTSLAAENTTTITAIVDPSGRSLTASPLSPPVRIIKTSNTTWSLNYLSQQALQPSKNSHFSITITDDVSGESDTISGIAQNTWRPGTAIISNNVTLAFKDRTNGQEADAKTWTYMYSSPDDQFNAKFELQTTARGTLSAQSWVDMPVGVTCVGHAYALAGGIVAANSDSGTQTESVIASAASSEETMGNLTGKLGLSAGIASGSIAYDVPYKVNVGDNSGEVKGSFSVSMKQVGIHAPGAELNRTLDHASTASVKVNPGIAGWSVHAHVTAFTGVVGTMTWSPDY